MKTFSKKLVCFVLVLVSIFALVGCGNGDKLTGKATVLINGNSTPSFSIDFAKTNLTKNDTVYDLLVYCQEEGMFTFEADQGNTFLTKIGDFEAKGNSYIAFYHNQQEFKDVSAYAKPNLSSGQKTLYYSGVGINGLKLCDGLAVFFTLESI